MRWVSTDDQLPPVNVPVLGTFLHRFTNAEWRWSQPYATRRLAGRQFDGAYMAPSMWAPIELPPLPDCPERDKAVARGRIEDEKHRKIEEIEQLAASAVNALGRLNGSQEA